ncbi:rhodanese-like domain-containing protein [Coraliomargarita parva]|uniref:rhodanese-like domain-containing protein n=1 Tax=Coraliomargarita parva TaxID=3014050 RepID=UPI0022B3368C|nr:rhodanese-like domain-containing protein [Coraliomargarita parva]
MLSLIKEFSLLLILVVIGSAYSLVRGWSPLPWAEPELQAGEIRYVDASALEVIWLDARSEAEYSEGHIEQALWFDEADWDNSLIMVMEEWLQAPRPIIVYCSDAACGTSKRVAERLRSSITDAEIYSLKGGWHL